MRHTVKITSIVACAGLCMTAAAQDSTSTGAAAGNGFLIGDALNPWAPEDQCYQYVVDLAPLTTSKGNVFGVAPLIKTSKIGSTNQSNVEFFNNLGSSSSISRQQLIGIDPGSGSYAFWNQPGFGVNPQQNTMPMAGTALMPQGNVNQFAVGISEFGFAPSGFSYDGLIGAVVQYESSDPNRLFVDRRMIAVDSTGPTSGDASSIGFGTVDASGNFYYRADGGSNNFPATGIPGIDSIFGNNIFRTRFFDRNCEVANVISNGFTAGGDTIDATDVLVDDFVAPDNDVWNTPNNVPASIAGGNGVAATTNFMTQYANGATNPLSTTMAHLDTSNGWGSDHRGALSSTQHDFLGNGADYTFSILSKDAADETTVFNAFGVDASGNVVGAKGFRFPLTLTDNFDGFMKTFPANSEFRQYVSQVAFQGGNGQVAIGSDTEGRGLMAGTLHENSFDDDFANQIIVLRYDADTGAEEWTMAAYVDQFLGGGKQICDAEGESIGQVVSLLSVTGGSPLGPSISSPAIDAAGNIWFFSSVELYNRIDTNGDMIPDASDFDGALIRGIYDPATFSYQLELVLELGTVIPGQNSGTNFRIDFLQTADGNSISSGSLWSSNASESAWNDTDISCLDPEDTRTNGGIFLTTTITYDVNGDDFYNDPTSAFYDDELPQDESYNVGLYISHYDDGEPTEPCPSDCPADLDNSGSLDFGDVSAFLTAFAMGDLSVDFDNSGSLDFGDVSTFLGLFAAGCP